MFTPAEPTPGVDVQAVYNAPVWLGSEDELLLRARLRTSDDLAYGRGTDTRSIARLQRQADGLYRGHFVYPDSVVFVLFAVSTPEGDAVDINLRLGWPLLAHDGEARPLINAVDQQLQDLTGRDFREGTHVARQYVDVYPDDPRSWNWLRFFEDHSSGSTADSVLAEERLARVRRFDRALSEKARPNPGVVSGLVWLAFGMDDEVAERWTNWLIKRVPGHPTAVQFRVLRASQENRGDAVATLAVLDRLWEEVGPAHHALLDYGFRTALQTGDAKAVLRWADRKSQVQPWAGSSVAAALAAEPMTREEGVRRLRAEIAQKSSIQDDERALFATVEEYRSAQRSETAYLQAVLGSALLESGDAAAALEPLEASASLLWDVDLLRDVADARLASGDSLGAARALARIAVDPASADADTVRARGFQLVGVGAWSRFLSEAEEGLRKRTLQSATSSALPEGVTVLNAAGERVNLASVLNKAGPTVVVLYSRYCGYSIEATSRIQALREQFAPEGVRVVVITAEPPGEASEVFFAEHGYTGPVYHDVDREVALAFGSAGTPHYFVLDWESLVRFRFTSLKEIPRQVAALQSETG